MIGLDSNVLLRHLVQDDPVQSRQATEIVEHRLTPQNPGFVSLVAVARIAWALDRSYGLAPPEIAAGIQRMLQSEVLVVQGEQEVFAAMRALQRGRGSFADALIGALGARAGCSHTVTFDRRALRLPYFVAP